MFYRERNVPEVSSLGSSGGSGTYSSRGKERVDNIDQANQEIERLRKTVEKLQGELQGGILIKLIPIDIQLKGTNHLF